MFNSSLDINRKRVFANFIIKSKGIEDYYSSIQENKQVDQQQAKIHNQGQSLRGGGCVCGNSINRVHPVIINLKALLPKNFLREMRKYLKVISDNAEQAYDERSKDQIIISVQWFTIMEEHFNNICNNDKADAATFDIMLNSLPVILQSAIILVKICGFICLQVLQIGNNIARVLYIYFLKNNKRIINLEQKSQLEQLIFQFETQLKIEFNNIWVSGAEFEISMIKAVVYNSQSTEGSVILKEILKGLVGSFAQQTISESLITNTIAGAEFLYKFQQTNDLRKKYEVYIYFESLKWELIQGLKGNLTPNKVIYYLKQTYDTYIENQQDWLINFCWIKMIGSILLYRPIIEKEELQTNDHNNQWKDLIQSKNVQQTSFNQNIGRLQLFQSSQNFVNCLRAYHLEQFQSFQLSFLQGLSFDDLTQPFSLREKSKIQKKDICEIFFGQQQNLIDLDFNFKQLFDKLKQNIAQLYELFQDINEKNRKKQIQRIQKKVYIILEILCHFHNYITVRRKMRQLQFLKYNLIVKQINSSQIQIKQNLEAKILSYRNQQLNDNSLNYLYNDLIKQLLIFLDKEQDSQFDQQTLQLINNLNRIKKQMEEENNLFFKPFEKENGQQILIDNINPIFSIYDTIKTIVNENKMQEEVQLLQQYIETNDFHLSKYKLQNFQNQLMMFQVVFRQIQVFLETNESVTEIFVKKVSQFLNNETDESIIFEKQKQAIMYFLKLRLEQQTNPSPSSPSLETQQPQKEQIINFLKYVKASQKDQRQQYQEIAELQWYLEYQELQSQYNQQRFQEIFNKIQNYDITQLTFDNMKAYFNETIQVYKINTIIKILNDNLKNAIETCQRLQIDIEDLIKDNNQQKKDETLNIINQFPQIQFDLAENEYSDNSLNSEQMLYSLILLIQEIQAKLYLPVENKDIINYKKSIFQEFKHYLEDQIERENYKVRECFVMTLLQISATSEVEHMTKFCQDRITQIWCFEKDNRVKALLKNTEFLTKQKKLFSGDLQSFSKQLQMETKKKFDQVKDLQRMWFFEKNEEKRQKLNDQINDIEDQIFNIDEMEQNLELGLYFLKVIKSELQIISSEMARQTEELQKINYKLDKIALKTSFKDILDLRKQQVLQQINLGSFSQVPIKFQEWDPQTGGKIGYPLLLFDFQDQIGEIGNFFINTHHDYTKDVMLIRGIRDSGQSIAAYKLEEFLWQQYNEQFCWIPIYVQLKTIFNPETNLIDEALKSEIYQFNNDHVREFKEALKREHLKITLILDGYDEMEVKFIKKNLYQTNRLEQRLFLNNLANMKIHLKLVITTDSEILTLRDYNSWFFGNELQSLKEVELLPIDQEDQSIYLKELTEKSIITQILQIENQNLNITESSAIQQKIYQFVKKENIQDNQQTLLTQEQVSQIINICYQSEHFRNLPQYHLAQYGQYLMSLCSVTKLKQQIAEAQLSQLLTTPLMIAIIVKVLPQMAKIIYDVQDIEKKFISNFEEIMRKDIKENILITEQNKKKGYSFPIQNDQILKQKDAYNLWKKVYPCLIQDYTQLKEKDTNNICKIFSNSQQFQTFTVIDKLYQNEIVNKDDVDVVSRALILKKLTHYEFYYNFIQFCQSQQFEKLKIKEEQNINKENFLKDVFDFSTSLALNMFKRNLTSVQYNYTGEFHVDYIKNSKSTDWKAQYFEDFQLNGEYKKLLRKCSLLKYNGDNYYFVHKSIQDFFVAHYFLQHLQQIQVIEKNMTQIGKIFAPGSENQKPQQFQQQKNQDSFKLVYEQQSLFQKGGLIDQFCQQMKYSIFNDDQLNISNVKSQGLLYLLQDEMKLIKEIKQRLYSVVKLSSISSDYIKASSNCLFLLSQHMKFFKDFDFKNIKIVNINLKGLSFYGCDLQESEFQNVDISCCQFNNVNLKNIKWSNIIYDEQQYEYEIFDDKMSY